MDPASDLFVQHKTGSEKAEMSRRGLRLVSRVFSFFFSTVSRWTPVSQQNAGLAYQRYYFVCARRRFPLLSSGHFSFSHSAGITLFV